MTGFLPFQHASVCSDLVEWLVRKVVVDIAVDTDAVASTMPEVQEANYALLFKILDSPFSFRLKMRVRGKKGW